MALPRSAPVALSSGRKTPASNFGDEDRSVCGVVVIEPDAEAGELPLKRAASEATRRAALRRVLAVAVAITLVVGIVVGVAVGEKSACALAVRARTAACMLHAHCCVRLCPGAACSQASATRRSMQQHILRR